MFDFKLDEEQQTVRVGVFRAEGDHYIFDAVSSPPDIMNRLYGLDPIAVWYQILQDETDLASLLDEDVTQLQVILDKQPSRDSSVGGLTADGPGRRTSRPRTPPTAPPSRSIPPPTSPGGS